MKPKSQSLRVYIDRQVSNGEWPVMRGKERYSALLDQVSRLFGKMVARLESDYIFCWMDWDGDNILCDGGIIDYGSLRQFGLFHHEYRYDDAERMSTSITEQKNKAKYIIQTFSQLVDYLLGGNKRPIKLFTKSSAVKLFLDVFSQTKNELLLNKMGFTDIAVQLFLRGNNNELINEFGRVYSTFERAKSIRGFYTVGDGISWDAIFCMRDILRELPAWYQAGGDWMTAEHFIGIIHSDYAEDKDVEISSYRRRQVRYFQHLYWQIVEKVASLTNQVNAELIDEVVRRAAVINRYERVTGDALIYVAKQLIKLNSRVSKRVLHQMFEGFVKQQVLIPGKLTPLPLKHQIGKRAASYSGYKKLFKVIRECREGI